MKNLWPVTFQQISIVTPKKILEEQADLLPKLTGDIIYADVVEMSDSQKEQYDFAYRFIIRGKFLENYSFPVFTFRHNIIIYPVKLTVGDDLAKELTDFDWNNSINLNNQEELEQILEKIFKSTRIEQVVGSIMALSK